MKILTGIMSHQSHEEYLESCRLRYPSRNRAGKSAMLDEVCDTLGWERKHAIKALNNQVSLGKQAGRRGSKVTHSEAEREVIVAIWKLSEYPCSVRLKETLPLWLKSFQKHHGKLSKEKQSKIISYSARTLDRIISPHRASRANRLGRMTGRTSHRLKTVVPIQCGPQDVDQPGWFEADTVSHGGGSSSGEFLWSLTLTDLYSGWTELGALWGNRGSEVRVGLENIEKRLPTKLLGFDCDNGSEFLNEVLEGYLLTRENPVKWTRSRPYKKNDQAHVEQKNFTHVRQLLGYGRFDKIELKSLVDEVYVEAWLPLRNYFTPVMKLVEKKRTGSKVSKKYDQARTPCDRLLDCLKVSKATKAELRRTRKNLDPIELANQLEAKLGIIFEIVERIEEERAEEQRWAEEADRGSATAGEDSVAPSVANAPSVSTASSPAEKIA